ncbi:MAG: hypothetical protein ISR50_01100 [Alphaproteobacteria bacterium]|nr:hypothetical protein [Alphaproteobacteria bacterium]
MMGMRPVCITDKIRINADGVPLLVYGVMLVLFIIFLPKDVVGASVDWWQARGNNCKLL